MSDYYRITTYDVNSDPNKDGKWSVYAARVRKWTIRKILRKLYAGGYDRETSIRVERVTNGHSNRGRLHHYPRTSH